MAYEVSEAVGSAVGILILLLVLAWVYRRTWRESAHSSNPLEIARSWISHVLSGGKR